MWEFMVGVGGKFGLFGALGLGIRGGVIVWEGFATLWGVRLVATWTGPSGLNRFPWSMVLHRLLEP